MQKYVVNGGVVGSGSTGPSARQGREDDSESAHRRKRKENTLQLKQSHP